MSNRRRMQSAQTIRHKSALASYSSFYNFLKLEYIYVIKMLCDYIANQFALKEYLK